MTQQRRHSHAGGIYAAAFATACALEQNPEKINFSNSELIMRNHLGIMLKNNVLRAFPGEPKIANNPVNDEEDNYSSNDGTSNLSKSERTGDQTSDDESFDESTDCGSSLSEISRNNVSSDQEECNNQNGRKNHRNDKNQSDRNDRNKNSEKRHRGDDWLSDSSDVDEYTSIGRIAQIAAANENITMDVVLSDVERPGSHMVEDHSIEYFLNILRNAPFIDREFIIHPIQMFVYVGLINDVDLKIPHLQIIGDIVGRCEHWITIYREADHLYVYDSLCPTYPSFLKMNRYFQRYIQRRYLDNHILPLSNIHFPRITQQPSGNSCGIYACATATSIMKGKDPSVINYSRN